MAYKEQSLRAACATVAFALAVPPAEACSGPGFEHQLLHNSLPSGTQGDFAAEVEVLSVGQSYGAFDAKVIRMIRGNNHGSRLEVRPTYMTSCDRPPEIAQKGFLIGKVIVSHGEAVVDPIRAPSSYQLFKAKQAETEISDKEQR